MTLSLIALVAVLNAPGSTTEDAAPAPIETESEASNFETTDLLAVRRAPTAGTTALQLGGGLVGTALGATAASLGTWALLTSGGCRSDGWGCLGELALSIFAGAAGGLVGGTYGLWQVGDWLGLEGRFLPTLGGAIVGTLASVLVLVAGSGLGTIPVVVAGMALPAAGAVSGYLLSRPAPGGGLKAAIVPTPDGLRGAVAYHF